MGWRIMSQSSAKLGAITIVLKLTNLLRDLRITINSNTY